MQRVSFRVGGESWGEGEEDGKEEREQTMHSSHSSSRERGGDEKVGMEMITVELTESSGAKEDGEAKFQCPITGLEFNGKYKFFALRSCGHVLSAKGFKEVKSSACLICHREFVESDKVVINGTEEEVKELWEKMLVDKKVKENSKKSKKLKNGEEVGRLTGKKHGIEANGSQNKAKAANKKFKVADLAPAHATKEIYASLFTSSKKQDFKETYSCRSLPLGRN